MSATRLSTVRLEKPWGRHQLWPSFIDATDSPIGEIWFEAPSNMAPELMVKYLFTSERLSIQVHPNDGAARAAGYKSGKDEAWVVLAAEPDATIGIGLRHRVSRDELRAAALDGSIVALVDWRPVKSGDVIFSPAGTIHAIGAGLTIVEVQQNVDLTYRLYDYGRPRALHLDAALAVAECGPAPSGMAFRGNANADGAIDAAQLLAKAPTFAIERWRYQGEHATFRNAQSRCWLIAVKGGGSIDGARYLAGECWLVEGSFTLQQDQGSDLLCAVLTDAIDSAIN